MALKIAKVLVLVPTCRTSVAAESLSPLQVRFDRPRATSVVSLRSVHLQQLTPAKAASVNLESALIALLRATSLHVGVSRAIVAACRLRTDVSHMLHCWFAVDWSGSDL